MCWRDGNFGTIVPDFWNLLSIFNEAWHFTACWTLFWVTMLKLLLALNLQHNLLIRFLLLCPFVCLICKFRSLGSMYLPYPKESSTFYWGCQRTPWYQKISSSIEYSDTLGELVKVFPNICCVSKADTELPSMHDLAWNYEVWVK